MVTLSVFAACFNKLTVTLEPLVVGFGEKLATVGSEHSQVIWLVR